MRRRSKAARPWTVPSEGSAAKSVRAQPARVQREAPYPRNKTKRSFAALVNAAVAAGGTLPPGGVGARAGHRALQLVDVVGQVFLAALERLLELFELGAPAVHL